MFANEPEIRTRPTCNDFQRVIDLAQPFPKEMLRKILDQHYLVTCETLPEQYLYNLSPHERKVNNVQRKFAWYLAKIENGEKYLPRMILACHAGSSIYGESEYKMACRAAAALTVPFDLLGLGKLFPVRQRTLQHWIEDNLDDVPARSGQLGNLSKVLGDYRLLSNLPPVIKLPDIPLELPSIPNSLEFENTQEILAEFIKKQEVTDLNELPQKIVLKRANDLSNLLYNRSGEKINPYVSDMVMIDLLFPLIEALALYPHENKNLAITGHCVRDVLGSRGDVRLYDRAYVLLEALWVSDYLYSGEKYYKK